MTRFLRQPDSFSCGPVALLNLDKWRGIKVTAKNLPQYKRLCKCSTEVGTYPSQLDRVLGKRGRRLSYQQFKAHHGAAIIDFTVRNGGHFFLVIGWGTNGKDFGWVAINSKHTINLISAQGMRSILRSSKVWTFSK